MFNFSGGIRVIFCVFKKLSEVQWNQLNDSVQVIQKKAGTGGKKSRKIPKGRTLEWRFFQWRMGGLLTTVNSEFEKKIFL